MIAICARGDELTSNVDQRFGRCSYFVIVDEEGDLVKAIVNPGSSGSGGSGVRAAQTLIDEDIKVVLAGEVGPKALQVLKTGEIDVYRGVCGNVTQAFSAFKEGQLDQINVAGRCE